MAVRSSAVGEDSDFSFAGQFLSLLNVSRDNLCKAYHQVVASLYSPEALSYRLLHGIPGESAQMGVGFVEMVEPVAGGVCFPGTRAIPTRTMCLSRPSVDWGSYLWTAGLPRRSSEFLEEGLKAESFALPRARTYSCGWFLGKGFGKRRSHPLWPPNRSDGPGSRSTGILGTEGRSPLRLHPGHGMGHGCRSTNLPPPVPTLAAGSATRPESRADCRVPVLLEGGEVGCPGAASGPAVHMTDDEDLDTFPEGGILIARRSSPRFVRLMTRARAIVTDAGSTTGHMASLAREFRIPTLLNTGKAYQSIPRAPSSPWMQAAGSSTWVRSRVCSRGNPTKPGRRKSVPTAGIRRDISN